MRVVANHYDLMMNCESRRAREAWVGCSDWLEMLWGFLAARFLASLLRKRPCLASNSLCLLNEKREGTPDAALVSDRRRRLYLKSLLEQTAGCLPARVQWNRQPPTGAAHWRATCHAHQSARVMCHRHMQMPALIQRRTAWSQRVSRCSSDSSFISLPFADATALPDASCTHWRYK